MKILFFTDSYLPSVNGIAMYIAEMSKQLAANGHEIFIFAPKAGSDEPIPLEHEHIKVHYLPSIPSHFYPDFRIATPVSISILAEVYDINPDIIHFHTQVSVGAQAIFLAKMLRKPLVATFHGYFWEPEYLKTFGLHKIKMDKSETIINLGWKYNNFFLKQADIVISPSERSKQDLIEHNFKKRVKVISNGINLSLYTAPKTEKMNLPKKYFLYIGRVSSEKSLDVLINAFLEFSKTNTEVDLVVVGDGPAKKQIAEQIQNSGQQNRIHMLGMIPHETLIHSNIFPDALAFVTTSKSESQPVSILEALASKLPIIGVNERGIPEMIGKNGILCQPDNYLEFAEALKTIAENPTLRKKMAQHSFEQAKKHSLEYSSHKLQDLYGQLIHRKQKKTPDIFD